MTIYAIPDIHGCLDKLENAFSKLKIKKNDKFIFLGDYIDRGKDSKGVIDFLINFKNNYNSEFLWGNHEQMFYYGIKFNQKAYYRCWIAHGGIETLQSYGITYNADIHDNKLKLENILPPSHIQFFKQLKPFYESSEFIFVHAGFNLNIPFNDNAPDDYLWIVPPFFRGNQPTFPLKKLIIHGHNIQEKIDVQPYRIGIDLGAFKENRPLIIFDTTKKKIAAASS